MLIWFAHDASEWKELNDRDCSVSIILPSAQLKVRCESIHFLNLSLAEF